MSSDPRNSPDLPPAKASHGTSSGKLCTIELHKDAMKFSAGHFTIFSAERRERLHGHNFAVAVELTGETDDCGLMGEYAHYKRIIQELCDNLDEYFLLPGHSPHLRLHTEGDQLVAEFAGKRMSFPREDVLVLPLRNITVEELAHYLCARLVDEGKLTAYATIHSVTVKVSSGPGQSGVATWRRSA